MVYFKSMDEDDIENNGEVQKNAEPPAPHTVVLNPRKTVKTGSPALWLIFLAVPLTLALIAGLNQTIPPEQEAAIVAQNAQASSASQIPQETQQDKTYQCNFSPWIGKPLTRDMIAIIEKANRPYRVLKPGAMVTQDYAPSRINLNVDDDGKILSVGCG